ncbi:hypothetical protein TcCL_ESM08696 [Trypanosoma cruzi]|nr:hypothetical protein TcCL_ESM08696 [Trypanosoma cruzi]
MEKRKRPIPDALIPTSSTNTLVASRHSSAHPGMPKSDVELSANNATIPAHMSAPPEKTHKSQTSPSTCHPNIIPTHRDTPNRIIRHPNAPPHTITYSMHHARQQPTRGQTNVLRISIIHVLRWEVNKRDELPNPKRVPRPAATQRNAATQKNPVLMPSASHIFPQKL